MIRKVEPRKDSCGSITDDSKKPLDRKLRRNFSHKMIPSILREERGESEEEKEGTNNDDERKERKKERKWNKRGKKRRVFIRIYRWRGSVGRSKRDTRKDVQKSNSLQWRRSIVARLIMRPNLTSISDCNNLLVL